MGVLLYLLISGRTLDVGLCLVGLGIIVGRWRPMARVVVSVGLFLAIVSAVPLHPAIYALLVVSSVAWLFSLSRSTSARRAVGAVVLAMAVWAGVSGGLPVRDGGVPLPPDTPVFVLGDSVSAGLGVGTHGTWPQLLAAERGLVVSNLARAGARLGDGSAQARSIPPGVAIVLVELGGNDLLMGTTAAKFETDLRSLLTGLAAGDRRVFMFELPLLPFQNAFGRIQRRACREHGVRLLPRSILAGAVALPGHATDGLHLSPQGHSWLARRVGELWAGE